MRTCLLKAFCVCNHATIWRKSQHYGVSAGLSLSFLSGIWVFALPVLRSHKPWRRERTFVHHSLQRPTLPSKRRYREGRWEGEREDKGGGRGKRRTREHKKHSIKTWTGGFIKHEQADENDHPSRESAVAALRRACRHPPIGHTQLLWWGEKKCSYLPVWRRMKTNSTQYITGVNWSESYIDYSIDFVAFLHLVSRCAIKKGVLRGSINFPAKIHFFLQLIKMVLPFAILLYYLLSTSAASLSAPVR